MHKNNLLYLFFAAIFGVLLTFGFSPYDNVLCVGISIVGLLYILEKNIINIYYKYISEDLLVTKKSIIKVIILRSFIIGFIYGIFHFSTSLYWISYSLTIDMDMFAWLIPLAIMGIPLVLSPFIGLMTVLVSLIIYKIYYTNEGKKNDTEYIINIKFVNIGYNSLQALFLSLSFATIWLICEYIRSYLILPFPWQLLGYASAYSLAFMQIASVVFVYGLSFIIAFSCCAIYTRNCYVISGTMFLIMCIVIWGNVVLNEESYIEKDVNNSKAINIRVIQGNNKEHAFNDINKKIKGFINNIETSNIKNTDNVDYIIWAESGFPFPLILSNDKDYNEIIYTNNPTITLEALEYLKNNILIYNKRLITGIDIYIKDEKRFFNSIAMFNFNNKNHNRNHNRKHNKDDKDISQIYNKRILVPFGEYIPWRNILGFLPIVATMGDVDFGVGDYRQSNIKLSKDNNIDNNKDIEIYAAPYICYEIAFPYPFAKDNIENADVIINITNDIWFGDSIGPYQHAAMARMRAIEYKKPLIRIANTGISMYIDEKGRVIKKIDLYKNGYFDVKIFKYDKINTK